MKLLSIALVGLFSVAATADVNGHWLLSKKTEGGFVIPELARTEKCRIYPAKKTGHYKVLIRNTFGDLVLKKSKYVKIENLEETIELASQENLVSTPNNICDAPETTTEAQIPGDIAQFTIFFTGGCANNELERQGSNSANLRALITKFCPTTIDFDLP
ncbi:MAG: hypothetical protein KC478_15875 [Bacteriovoracaceae bacterium]|nr:hypothetical protein [Bacteriovoracaceae bacterium]